MGTALALLFGLAVPVVAVTLTICLTVLQHKRMGIQAELELARQKHNAHTEELMLKQHAFDTQAQFLREGQAPPSLPR